MPSVKQYQAIQYNGFPNGLNLHADSSRLEPDELSLALNVQLGPRGEVKLRNGYVRQDDGVQLVLPSYWVRAWVGAVGSSEFLFAIGESGTGQVFIGVTSFFATTAHINPVDDLRSFGVAFAAANKNMYISAKTMDDVHKYDGFGQFTTAVPTMPKAKLMHYRHGRMFSINDIARPSAVYFSELLDVETFGVEDFIELDPDDGYEINASAIFGDDLILFKDKAVWKLSGRTPSSFATYRLDNHRGSVAPRCVDQIRGRLVFLDRETGVWAFDGASFELISEPINDYILENQDFDRGYRASAYVADDRYYLSIPWTGGGFRTFIYFADTGGWMEYDTGFESAIYFDGGRILGLPGADGLYKPDINSQVHPPSVTPLVGRYRTGWALLGGAGVKARVRRIEATVKANVGVTGTVRMYRDYDDQTPYVTRTFEGGPTPFSIVADERRISLDGWGNRVHAVMFEFETNEFPFQMNDLTVFFTGGTDVRGER